MIYLRLYTDSRFGLAELRRGDARFIRAPHAPRHPVGPGPGGGYAGRGRHGAPAVIARAPGGRGPRRHAPSLVHRTDRPAALGRRYARPGRPLHSLEQPDRGESERAVRAAGRPDRRSLAVRRPAETGRSHLSGQVGDRVGTAQAAPHPVYPRRGGVWSQRTQLRVPRIRRADVGGALRLLRGGVGAGRLGAGVRATAHPPRPRPRPRRPSNPPVAAPLPPPPRRGPGSPCPISAGIRSR